MRGLRKGHQPFWNWELLHGYRFLRRAIILIHTSEIRNVLKLSLIMSSLIKQMITSYGETLIMLTLFSKQALGWHGARAQRVGDTYLKSIFWRLFLPSEHQKEVRSYQRCAIQQGTTDVRGQNSSVDPPLLGSMNSIADESLALRRIFGCCSRSIAHVLAATIVRTKKTSDVNMRHY